MDAEGLSRLWNQWKKTRQEKQCLEGKNRTAHSHTADQRRHGIISDKDHVISCLEKFFADYLTKKEINQIGALTEKGRVFEVDSHPAEAVGSFEEDTTGLEDALESIDGVDENGFTAS